MILKSLNDIVDLIASTGKEKERILGIKIRNGQHVQGINQALSWVIKK